MIESMATSDQSVTPAEVRAFFEAKALRRQVLLDKRFAEASRDCALILEMIRNDYKPVRIWQWGSLLRRERFSEISDIDIAVEGVNEPRFFFEMYGKASGLTTFPLDLVDIDAIEPVHAESIRTRGRLVYERT